MVQPLWVPSSPFRRLANCVFLARVVDKARRFVGDLPMGEYMYGDNDYMDSRVFGFLNTNAARLNAIVRAESNDERVARLLIEYSGKSPQQVARFSNRMLLFYGLIFAMFDADEGRTAGAAARFAAAFYNRVIYPPFAKKFEADESRSRQRATP